MTRESAARAELAEAERRAEEVNGGRRSSDEAKTEAARAVRRASVAATDAAETVTRMRERIESLARDEIALTAEAEGLAVEARHIAAEVAEVPRLSDSGRTVPGDSLAEIDEWGARAHAALFVVRGGLEGEREKVVLEANALAAAALGEQAGGGVSRSCVAGSRSRSRRSRCPPGRLREAGVLRPQVERAAVAAAFREPVVEPLHARVREVEVSWARIRFRAVAASRPSRRPSPTPSWRA